MRHLDVGTLWLQEQQLRLVLKVVKVLGTANPADLMTKHVPKEVADKYAALLGFEFVGGLAATASRLYSAEESGAREPPLAARRGSSLRREREREGMFG